MIEATTLIPSYAERVRWFHQSRFGMFIHWGLYALLGRGEWTMWSERIPVKTYAKLADRFTAPRFDPDAWAALAVEAGMKYAIFTTRHHDGFCLYDSDVSDFTSTKTAAKRDFVADYVRAFRKAGLKVGLYYSLMDWRFPGCFNYETDTASREAMVQQAHAQVRELLTQYGRIDMLWYDGNWLNHDPKTIERAAEIWRSEELNAMARSLQPHILINNRAGTQEDLDTPEQAVRASEPGRAWESCMTMGDFFGWGYLRDSPNLKPTATLIQALIQAAASEGNLLLNVGPRPDGSIRREEVTRLQQMGQWMQMHSKSIYGSKRSPLYDGWFHTWTGDAKNPSRHYYHLLRWPGTQATYPCCKTRVKQARLMGSGEMLKVEQDNEGRIHFKGLPAKPVNRHSNVIEVTFAEPPKMHQASNPASWLDSKQAS